MGLAELSCSILIDNKASIALWRRQGAEMKEDNGRMNPVLKI